MGFPGQLISTNNQTQEEHGEKGSIISNLSSESWFVKGWTGTGVEIWSKEILLLGTDGHFSVSLGSAQVFRSLGFECDTKWESHQYRNFENDN